MSELALLHVLLLLSMAVGRFGVHRTFLTERARRPLTVAHGVALLCAAAGLLAPVPLLCVVWLLFTATSFAVFLRERRRRLRSLDTLIASVPFLFSNVAAVWLVAGANDLHLLGYGAHFSAYAALHGNVLGWIVLGAIAELAHRDGRRRSIHRAATLVCGASFLLVALGIDQLRLLKPIGVVGLSIALPASLLAFLDESWRRNRTAFALAATSLSGLLVTMVLAWRNELALAPVPEIGGVRSMVALHGVLNAVVVAPSFLAAVALDAPPLDAPPLDAPPLDAPPHGAGAGGASE